MEKSQVKDEHQQIDVNFESHPPIPEDFDGILRLLRQLFLSFVDCFALAQHIIDLKDITQVIATEPEVEDNEEADNEDEPDDNIYGVTSVIDLQVNKDKNMSKSTRTELLTFLREKFPKFSSLSNDPDVKFGFIVNERYINLPPQLSLPTLKNLTHHLDKNNYTHILFLSKIFIKHRSSDSNLPSKKIKTSNKKAGDSSAEPLVFANPEEEIIFEGSESHIDVDVSGICDENASWAFGGDVKYVPHRRILLIDYEKWPAILKNLEKELDGEKKK